MIGRKTGMWPRYNSRLGATGALGKAGSVSTRGSLLDKCGENDSKGMTKVERNKFTTENGRGAYQGCFRSWRTGGGRISDLGDQSKALTLQGGGSHERGLVCTRTGGMRQLRRKYVCMCGRGAGWGGGD